MSTPLLSLTVVTTYPPDIIQLSDAQVHICFHSKLILDLMEKVEV